MKIETDAYIDGVWTSATDGKRFTVTNPATGQIIAEVADCGSTDASNAVMAAERAFQSWKNLLPKERADHLRAWKERVERDAEELAVLLTSEQGKPLPEARGEISAGIAMLEWSAEEARRAYGDTIPPFKKGARAITTREPIGVVAAITPWNFPHSMITRKLGPALAAGCTVVLKPAEDTPLSALALARLADEAGLPKGVLNILPTSEPEKVGAILTSSPHIRKLSFTGSTEIGRLLMQQCAPTLKRLSMELGGNAPFIVFDDADIEEALSGLIASKFRNAGQTCICANRIFVQNGIRTVFRDRLANRIKALKIGNGLENGVTIGPLVNDAGLRKVETIIAEALSAGAQLVCGGRKPDTAGTFYEPTLLDEITPDMRIANEEIFGPVATLIPFDTEEEAINMANATEHGLAAYVFTQNLGRAFRLSERLEYGMVAINEPLLASEAIPFGGIKQSGFGREGGKQSLDDYTQTKYTLFGGL